MTILQEVLHTTWDDFDKCPVEVFNENYSGGNPLEAEGDVYFTCVGVPYDQFHEGYAVTVAQLDGGWACEFTGYQETGLYQSDIYELPEIAWADSKKRFLEEA